MAPETAPDPKFSGLGVRNRDLLFEAAKAFLILNPDPDPDFFAESHSRFCQKIGNDPKMKFRTLSVNIDL